MNYTQGKLLIRYEQTSLNSVRTFKTGPSSFNKWLKLDKNTSFTISGFKIAFFNSKSYDKKCMRVFIEAVKVMKVMRL